MLKSNVLEPSCKFFLLSFVILFFSKWLTIFVWLVCVHLKHFVQLFSYILFFRLNDLGEIYVLKIYSGRDYRPLCDPFHSSLLLLLFV
ncbi:hypothetical protein HanXRQr2_Chr12g0544211 [Helianthus annuus]|uniref:Uncharacterized protein n=1 Tax=Helianthus annuus TaxID=4232 RepID=A0A9K3HH85_HELAN|nr:hypothetical protein HanXRQr2_Chr12g0544211 [Helianthus annuus]